MKALLVAPVLALAGLAHAETQQFKAWSAGCDNTLTCTAIGMPLEDGGDIAYVRITRAAGPDAAPEARVVVMSQGDENTPAVLTVAIDGKPFGGKLKGTSDGAWARADIPAADAPAFIAALVNARTITIHRVDDSFDKPVALTLDGSSAALRWLDAAQKRDGGVTAIVAKGEKPASAVPAAPPTPVVAARRIAAFGTMPKPPAALPAADADMCFDMSEPNIAYDLGDGVTLWGVCSGTGAYNFSYDMYVAGKDGKLTPVSPPKDQTDGATVLTLTNPYPGANDKTLSAFAKGRGIGDCGDAQDWAWDGKTLQRVGYAVMESCRGVSPDDWIVLYRATLR